MPAVLTRAPSARTFAQAWVEHVLLPALEEAAGANRRLSSREATDAAGVNQGPLSLAGGLLDQLRRATGQSNPTIDAVKAQGQVYAEEMAAQVAGGNSLSFSEAERLPALLAAGYLVLRGRVPAVPDPDPPPPPSDLGLGVISDIDKTVLPPESHGQMQPAYAGVAALYRELEKAADRHIDATYYVTARQPERVVAVPAWMNDNGLPHEGISTGLGGQPWIAEPEKVRDITALFDAHPDRRFVLFGDTDARDPEVYRRMRQDRPDQVAAIVIHKVNNNVSAARVEGMIMVDNYAQAAAALFHLGLLSRSAANRVIAAARAQGLDISRAEGDALLNG